MNKDDFKKAQELAKRTGQPVLTAVQKKSEYNGLRDYQIDILESMKMMGKCDIIISLKKDRKISGSHRIYMDHVGKKITSKKN